MNNALNNRFTSYGQVKLLRIVKDLNGDSIYLIQVVPGLFHCIVTRAWGKVGSRIRVREDFLTHEQAFLEANRVYLQKLKRGFVEVNDYPIRRYTGRPFPC